MGKERINLLLSIVYNFNLVYGKRSSFCAMLSTYLFNPRLSKRVFRNIYLFNQSLFLKYMPESVITESQQNFQGAFCPPDKISLVPKTQVFNKVRVFPLITNSNHRWK